ncbi:MAG: penicillin-binding protein 1C [Cypionkella sp.]|nr:penicillin-binding protein 1C [Cypionkella sp.]
MRLTLPGARWLFALALGLGLTAFGRDQFDDWVDATRLPNLSPPMGAQVLGSRGDLLRAYTVAGGRWRLEVPLDQVDPAFIAGLIAYEDGRFYTHSGVDLRALARAGVQALRQGRVVSGASTLTMQTARLLEGGTTGQMQGKLRQMRLAWALERRLTKSDILHLYLNIAPYGGNIEGLRAASLAYFGKEPRRLTPAEVALLIALPQSPAARRPDRAPDVAMSARARVLARLSRDGLIDKDTAAAAQREAVPRNRKAFPALAPHLADQLLREQGAGVITTTLDKSLQIALQDLAAQSVAGLGDQVQIALIVADHATGAVLAHVGSSGYNANARGGFIDMTRAQRSPGSTLKPMIYALAMDQGLIHPETLMQDQPTDFGGYRPQNFDRKFRGQIRVRDALQQSLNIPVVSLTDALGPSAVLAGLSRAGAEYALPTGEAGLAIGLGGIGVTLHDLVQLYAAQARGGEGVSLRFTPQTGQPLRRVMSRAAAWQLGDILAGLPPPAGAPPNRLAYKTGTSYGNRDAWAIGYDGAHVIGVWIGRPDGTPMPGALGADLAAPVLFSAFARLKPALTPLPPAPPETLLLANGQLPEPLRQFRPRGAAFDAKAGAPKLIFPPDGAEVQLLRAGLLLRIEGGAPPFTILANSAPLRAGLAQNEVLIESLTSGFVTLSVIDAKGASSQSRVRLLAH